MTGSARRDDWKAKILADFARWLDNLPNEPLDPGPTRPRKRALSDLYSLMMVLARDVARQNRSSTDAVARLQATNAGLSAIGDSLRGQSAAIQRLIEAQGAGLQGEAVAVSFLGIRDALVRTHQVACEPQGEPAHRSPELEGVASSLALILRKFDTVLGWHGITQVKTVGEPFDPATMNAVDTLDVPEVPTGTVAQEVRGGFMIGDRLLQTADVIVSVRQQAEDSDATGEGPDSEPSGEGVPDARSHEGSEAACMISEDGDGGRDAKERMDGQQQDAETEDRKIGPFHGTVPVASEPTLPQDDPMFGSGSTVSGAHDREDGARGARNMDALWASDRVPTAAGGPGEPVAEAPDRTDDGNDRHPVCEPDSVSQSGREASGGGRAPASGPESRFPAGALSVDDPSGEGSAAGEGVTGGQRGPFGTGSQERGTRPDSRINEG